MNVWFVRANGETVHNGSSIPNYVPGEPPEYPETKHNYRAKCLSEGFARIGWPNTGDLHQPGLNRLAVEGYTFASLESRYQDYLTQFASIRTGDLILLPADAAQYEVHIGVVVLRDRITRQITSRTPGQKAYYYYHDIPNRQWYECAHRVDVAWAADSAGSFSVRPIEGIAWRLAFSPVVKVKDKAITIAREAYLL